MDDLIKWFAEEGGFSNGTKAPHKWVLQAEQELRIQAAALAEAQAEIARLRGALAAAEQDFYQAANQWRDEDYEGPHERFTVPVVCHVKPYFDLHMKHLTDSAERARAALEPRTPDTGK